MSRTRQSKSSDDSGLVLAPLGADGKPGTWREVGLTNPRAIPVNGLTPGRTTLFNSAPWVCWAMAIGVK